MRTFGLIGYPLAHSFSKKFFTEKFEKEGIAEHKYELFPIENIAAVVSLIAADSSLSGLNVTIPHKVGVMPYLNELEPAAEKIGAVNCISIKHQEGKTILKGYNTDAFGFQESLKPYLKKHHTRALILGDGGAAKAVKYVLDQLNITYLSVVRKAAPNAILYSDLTEELIQKHQVIINTTPLGTFPNIEASPAIPYQWLTGQHLAYDLVYNPEETEFLKRAKAQGAAVKNGYEMLQLQAERSWVIWNS
ncbi:shikimate dehydrogenase family protein [Pedobacter sp. NJ-S-72]